MILKIIFVSFRLQSKCKNKKKTRTNYKTFSDFLQIVEIYIEIVENPNLFEKKQEYFGLCKIKI